jgi:small nuclear ribonucleoprotein (snRNP)-like protein
MNLGEGGVKTVQLIDPICDANIKPYLGKHVCVVLTDGTTIYGTLGGLNGQQLMLKSCLEGGEVVSTNSVKAKSQLKKKQEQAKTSALGAPYGYGGYPYGAGFGLDLALIALLFAIPFLWI